jgi:CTP:molybdopterin cytidylyltransferase MocA
MAYSLRIADEAIDANDAIAVLLGDLADITRAAIGAAVDAYDDTIDVIVPRSGATFAHPVIFGPRARRKISTLPAGDTIKLLRDDTSLRRRIVDSDGSALIDIDTPGDYTHRMARENEMPETLS